MRRMPCTAHSRQVARPSSTGGRAIVAIIMARKRRRSGHVREAVLRLLQDAPRPLGALEIEKLLFEEGETVPPNTVFRALRELIDRGMIRKVMVARGYALGSGAQRISLFCRACGESDRGCGRHHVRRTRRPGRCLRLHRIAPHRGGRRPVRRLCRACLMTLPATVALPWPPTGARASRSRPAGPPAQARMAAARNTKEKPAA